MTHYPLYFCGDDMGGPTEAYIYKSNFLAKQKEWSEYILLTLAWFEMYKFHSQWVSKHA